MAARSEHLRSARPKRASRLIGSPVRHGISACSAFKDRPSHRRRSATRSMLVISILKSNALAATPTKPSPSTLCGGRRRRRYMNWSVTCAARIARKSVAIHSIHTSHLPHGKHWTCADKSEETAARGDWASRRQLQGASAALQSGRTTPRPNSRGCGHHVNTSVGGKKRPRAIRGLLFWQERFPVS
jgi:hypothetical protein